MTAPRFEVRAATARRGTCPSGRAHLQYLRRNPSLVIGLLLLGGLALFSGFGRFAWNTAAAAPLSAPPAQPPAEQRPGAAIRRDGTCSP